MLLYFYTLFSPSFNFSRILAEELKMDTLRSAKLLTKKCMEKLSAEHYYNEVCAKLQFCVQIYKSGVQIYKPPI